MPALACFDVAASAAVTWDSASLPAPGPLASGGVTSSATNASAAVQDRLLPPWSIDRSAELYKVESWGAPYFSVNDSGNVSVRPHGCETLPYQEIDLMKIVKKASDPKHVGGLGLQLPVIVRFPDVLRNRLESLQSAFDYAIRSNGYDGYYQGVYPVKCNQDRFLVEDIVEFGTKHHFGLEAGSKPELLLAMSCLTKGSPEAFLICNGYKDEEYISLALMARKLGLNTVIVLEREEELDTVVQVSRKLGVRPMIGLRAKLRTKHSGHFGPTSGEKGKFGLTTVQILSVVKKLNSLGILDCLHLLHFHIGSQIPSTGLLSDGVAEAAQIYCELARLGADMKVIDVGGGLGIDYDGTHSVDSDMSVGYSLDEYASAVVQAVLYACDQKNVPHPTIVSESGRALVSHHSVLVFEAVSSVVGGKTAPLGLDLAYLEKELPGDSQPEYCDLMAAAVHGDLDTCGMFAGQLKRRCVEQFKEGSLGLEHLVAVDGLCEIVSKVMQQARAKPVKTYHANLSVFTSVPDLWGIGQLFPIMPIHRLDERPTVDGVLSDLTCDSDGKIDRFIGGKDTLPLHELDGGGAGYYLGMFLGGAYQEALGGLHNLFGGPSVVRVSQSDGPHCFAVTRAVPGPSCADILRAVQHQPEVMFETLKQRVEEYVAVGGDDVVCHLASVFDSMPYLVTSAAASHATAINYPDKEDGTIHRYHCDDVEDTSDSASAACDELECDIYRHLLEW